MTIDLRKQHPEPKHHTEAQLHETPPPTPQRRSSTRTKERVVTVLVVCVLAIALVMVLSYGAMRAWRALFGSSTPAVHKIVSDVADHMLLPEDETPSLATVTDMNVLEDQEFFKHAREGDMVLMYMQSRKAIIYRPSIDRIIEVGPITGGAQ